MGKFQISSFFAGFVDTEALQRLRGTWMQLRYLYPYYGFHGDLLISLTGVITGFTLTPANGSERAALWDMVSTIQGLLIGDKGYLSRPLQHQLQAVGIQLETGASQLCENS